MIEKNQNESELINSEEPLFAWSAPEFIKKDRSPSWYLIVCISAFAIAVILYFFASKSGSLLAIVAPIFLIFFSRQKAKEMSCAIYEKGIVTDGRVYNYKDIKSFSIHQDEVMPKIRLQISGRFGTMVVLPLKNVDPQAVYQAILAKIPEVNDRSNDIIDIFNKYL